VSERACGIVKVLGNDCAGNIDAKVSALVKHPDDNIRILFLGVAQWDKS
jgi:hypothetical protein